MMKKITLLGAIFAMATMTANAQTVTKALDNDGNATFNWADATEFVPIITGEAESAEMEGKIKDDFRPDDITKHLYVWSGTYTDGDGSGINSFGQVEDHTAFVVGNVGWSGFGIIDDNAHNLSFIDDSYILHFAIKGNPATSHAIGLGSVKFAIGDAPFVDNNTTVKNFGTWKNDGEWYYVDVPFSMIKKLGDVWPLSKGGPTAYKGDNFFFVLSGGVAGTELHLDNIFLYKSKSLTTGINNLNSTDNSKVEAIYDLQGRELKDCPKHGVYIIKTANSVKKVSVK